MNRNTIKKLARASYTKNTLDEKKVKRISENLKRTDLKIYVKDLKIMEMKKTVTINIPSEEGIREMQTYFSKIYPGKKLVFNIDESLITGIKVDDYDNSYELSLRGFLEQAIKQTYD